ncbi:major facilitator superfamily domain-containing protein [Podospora didyma]|uniref:Major facilitator superfamily domain-containing protein n=1 Tax=Podospora didyma TaxID=330526 RepID=A0AAE0NP20_9PEZI|nr:major facilitator superfamily domain-containing protein [Podospora didyma]
MREFKTFARMPSPTMYGLIISSILVPASISSLFAEKLADSPSRAREIAIGSLIVATSAALEASFTQIAMFIAGRMIQGVGQGLYIGKLVVYICEISPPKHRGAVSTGLQLFITLGLVAGFFTCYGTGNIQSSLLWRLPFALLAVCAVGFSATTDEEAAEAWESLHVPTADREEIVEQLEPLVARTTAATGPDVSATSSTAIRTIGLHERNNRNESRMPAVLSSEARPRLLLAVFLMGMQQLSGIDEVLYATFLASGVFAIVIVAVTIPATLCADRWGQRLSTILGGIGMAATMFVKGALYAAEIQRQRTRASATSIAHGSNWLMNFLVALVTPTLLDKSSNGAYLLFVGCTFLTAVVCWLFMPEARGRSLDEIDEAF